VRRPACEELGSSRKIELHSGVLHASHEVRAWVGQIGPCQCGRAGLLEEKRNLLRVLLAGAKTERGLEGRYGIEADDNIPGLDRWWEISAEI